MNTGRNEPCPCGSGKKYKKCCGDSKSNPPTLPWQQKANTASPNISVKAANSAQDEFNQLVALYNTARYAELESRARLLVEQYPGFGLGWKLLSASLMMQGKDDLLSLQMATKLLPGEAELHNNLGIALAKHSRNTEAEACFRRALQIKPDYTDAHYNLGSILHEHGRLDEAEASYRRALQHKQDYADAHGNLGGVLREQGKLVEALACYQQQLRLAPENVNAQHHIASLTGKTTERAPARYVEKAFDDYADKFDTHLQQILKYEVPEKLVALVMQHSTPPVEKWNVLDLGCGTGLVGSAIAPFARQLVGVDLSAKMLGKAHVRNLYQRLEHLDLLTMMRAEKTSSYNVIVAADVFVYIGKLDEIISEIRRLLCPGGIFAFSIEALEGGADIEASQGIQQEYQLNNTGRYSHSADYITKLASANGFLPLEMAATQIRMEKGKPVSGYLVLWEN